jgi:hypothetical protein
VCVCVCVCDVGPDRVGDLASLRHVDY